MSLAVKKPRRRASGYFAMARISSWVNRWAGEAVAAAAILGTMGTSQRGASLQMGTASPEHTARSKPMPLFGFEGKRPVVHPTAFIAPTAVLVGDVTVEENASVWYNAVLRADFAPIVVRRGANVQDC